MHKFVSLGEHFTCAVPKSKSKLRPNPNPIRILELSWASNIGSIARTLSHTLSNYVRRLSILDSRAQILWGQPKCSAKLFQPHTLDCVWKSVCVCVCLCVPTSISIIWSALQLRLQFSRSAYGGHFMAFHWFGWPTKGGRGQGEGKGHNCLGAGYGFRFFVCVFVDLATKQRKMYKNRWLFCGPHGNRLRKNIDAVGEHLLHPKPKSEGTRSQYTPAVAIASKGEKEWERSGTKTAESKHAGACFTAVFVWSFMWPIYGLHVVVCV